MTFLAPLAHWVHDLDPVLIQFTDAIAIRWYGLAYVAGFLTALGLLVQYERQGRSSLNRAERESLFIALVIGVMAGGRLGYVLLYDTERFLSDPLVLFRVWEGGMASHGGFIGVALALAWFCHRTGWSYRALGDIVVTLAPAGLFFGRIANFINGELWGKVSDVPWAVVFPQSLPGYPVESIPARHPSQLYAAALEGLVLFAFIQWRFWRSGNLTRFPGQIAGEFLVAYSALRIVGEVFRAPDASLILGLSRGTFYSLLVAAIGIAVIVWSRSSAWSTER